MENNNQIDLSNKNELSKYSSDFFKKGLDLIQRLESTNDNDFKSSLNASWRCVYTLQNFSDLLNPISSQIKKNHHAIAVDPNGQFIVGVNKKGEIKAFDLITKELYSLEQEGILDTSEPRRYVCISSNGTIVCISNKRIETWTSNDQLRHKFYSTLLAGLYRLDINLSQEVIAYHDSSGFYTNTNGRTIYRGDNRLKIFCIENKKVLCSIKSNLDDIECISVNFHQNKVAVSGYRLLDIELDRYEEDSYSFGRYSIEVWNLRQENLLYDLDEKIDFQVYDLEHENNKEGIYNTSVIISPNGNSLIGLRDYIGIPQSSIKVWNLKNFKLFFSISEKVNSLSVSPNERMIYISENNSIKIRDLETGDKICEIESCSKTYYEVFSRGSNFYLVTGGEDRTVKIWDIDTGDLLHILSGHKHPIKSIVANSSGSLIATTDIHDETKLWSSNIL